jgi:N-terminal C2 in EEIG1 and EHBP1 proteins
VVAERIDQSVILPLTQRYCYRYVEQKTLWPGSRLSAVNTRQLADWQILNNTLHKTRLTTENSVSWDEEFTFDVTMVLGKDGILQSSEIQFTIKQEIDGGRTSDSLGTLIINLAEHTYEHKPAGRHLLQKAKLNALLKVDIQMNLVKGEKDVFLT